MAACFGLVMASCNDSKKQGGEAATEENVEATAVTADDAEAVVMSIAISCHKQVLVPSVITTERFISSICGCLEEFMPSIFHHGFRLLGIR